MADSAQVSHPDASQLAGVAQGKLVGPQREALQAHLKSCPACRQALVALPGGADSLSGEEAQAVAGAGAPPPGATVTYHLAGEVSADLANHPRYEVLQLLGQGGMGAVYKARHRKMDRIVALKVINAKLLANLTVLERFQREMKAAAKLDHPNIVRAYDADEAGGTHFLVMEFVEGIDLAKYVGKKGPLPVAHACHFIRQAALGLQHAHERGMVHRDIKPHNLMLASDPLPSPPVLRRRGVGGEGAEASPPLTPGPSPLSPGERGARFVVKVMDFGLARFAREGATESGLTGENALMGTADYIAPEQARDAHTADIRADIYSLGCTFYHLLAGKPPFAGVAMAQKIAGHLTGTIALADLPASVPAELRDVLGKMVAKDPAQRYQAPGEVAAALVPFLKKASAPLSPVLRGEGLGVRGSDSPAPSPPAPRLRSTGGEGRTMADAPVKQKRQRPLPLLIAGGMLAALLLVGAIVWLASRSSQPAEEPPPVATNGVTVKAPEALPATYTNRLGMEFVLVPRGKFLMGGGGGTVGDKEVEIPHDFYLGMYEVTQEEWEKATGNNPSAFKAVAGISREDQQRFPVEQVSWDDAQLFVEALNKREREAGWVYRLPKEPEWEYACRGGPTGNKFDYRFDFYFDKPAKELLPEQANFAHGQGLKRTCKVGSYQPNRLGLYDMHGNVWEWCDDEQKVDKGASHGVYRGGGWDYDAGGCRAALRFANPPLPRYYSIGVRVARVPVGGEGK